MPPKLIPIMEQTTNDPVDLLARTIWGEARGEPVRAPTGGATHYHSVDVHPRWAAGKTPHARIGRHLFYADID